MAEAMSQLVLVVEDDPEGAEGLRSLLQSGGHEVRVVCAPPYYPEWKVAEGYSSWRGRQETRNGVRLVRAPLWVWLAGLEHPAAPVIAGGVIVIGAVVYQVIPGRGGRPETVRFGVRCPRR